MDAWTDPQVSESTDHGATHFQFQMCKRITPRTELLCQEKKSDYLHLSIDRRVPFVGDE
jgi:hypothetical protein